MMIERRSYSVDEFCEAENICRTQLYKLWSLGKGPRFWKNGVRRRISDEARAEWRRQMEAEASGAAV